MLGAARAVMTGVEGVAAAAPTINGAESIVGINSASTSQNVSLGSQTFTAGDYLLALGAVGGNVTVTACAGATDDTYAEILETGAGSGAGLTTFEGTVVSSLDASIDFTLSPSRRFAGGLITISGTSGNASNPNVQGEAEGTTNDPASPSIETTVASTLVLSIIGASGGHDLTTLLGALPEGYTFGASARSSSSSVPSNDAHSTIAFAHKEQSSAGVVAAAEWTDGLGAAVAWRAQSLALGP